MQEDAKQREFDISNGLDPETIMEIRSTVEEWLTLAGVDRGLLGILVILIEEVATNVMDHSGAQWMEMGAAWFEDGVVVSITDNGREFDPTGKIKAADISASLDEHTERHLGMPMIQKICDNFAYVRDPTGINRLVLEIPNKTFRQAAE